MYGDPIGAQSTFQDPEGAEGAGASIFFNLSPRQGQRQIGLGMLFPETWDTGVHLKLGHWMVIEMEDFLLPHGLMMQIQVFHPAFGLTERGASPVFCAVFAAPLSLASRKVQA